VPYPALLSNGNIAAGGNSSINGTYGSVHSNGNLSVDGSAYVAQSATASGTYSGPSSGSGSGGGGGGSGVGGFAAGGQPRIYMPKYITDDPDPHIQSYLLRYTDILLIDPDFATGADTSNPPTATDAATTRLMRLATSISVSYGQLRSAISDPTSAQAVAINRTVNPPTATNISVSSTGWSYNGGSNANWGLSSVPPAGLTTPSFNPSSNAYTFYVVGLDNFNSTTPSSSTSNGGNVKVTGNVGSDASPAELTVFATGSIELAGTPNMVAHLKVSTPELPPYDKPEILFVCVEDLKTDGDLDVASKFNGIIYLGEQFDLSGNGRFDGQILGKNNDDISGSPVSANKIWGHFNLTLNTGGMMGTVKIISWRQIKE